MIDPMPNAQSTSHSPLIYALGVVMGLFILTPQPSLASSLPGLRPPPPKIHQSPDGFLSFQIPAGWALSEVDGSKKTVLTPIQTGGNAKLLIERIEVPAGAHPRQLRLRSLETHLRKLKGFESLSERDIAISGQPAAVVTGSYPWQGNIQYPRAVEQTFVVLGTHALRIHFECFQPAASTFAPAVALVYSTLTIRSEASNAPAKAQPKPTPSFVDSVGY